MLEHQDNLKRGEDKMARSTHKCSLLAGEEKDARRKKKKQRIVYRTGRNPLKKK